MSALLRAAAGLRRLATASGRSPVPLALALAMALTPACSDGFTTPEAGVHVSTTKDAVVIENHSDAALFYRLEAPFPPNVQVIDRPHCTFADAACPYVPMGERVTVPWPARWENTRPLYELSWWRQTTNAKGQPVATTPVVMGLVRWP